MNYSWFSAFLNKTWIPVLHFLILIVGHENSNKLFMNLVQIMNHKHFIIFFLGIHHFHAFITILQVFGENHSFPLPRNSHFIKTWIHLLVFIILSTKRGYISWFSSFYQQNVDSFHFSVTATLNLEYISTIFNRRPRSKS